MKKILTLSFAALLCAVSLAQPLNNTKQPGYKGIWFTLGQESEYGYKYSGGLATYTVKHNPMAVYAPKEEKTFFVYGGTTAPDERHLLCMIGCFDHRTGLVQKPVCVFDKEEVNDPHDNPAIQIDKDGHLWVFVSGRSRKRPGYIYRSDKPYDINSFSQVLKLEMTYPQPMYDPELGFIVGYTKYTGIRQLYWMTSPDGKVWDQGHHLADIKTPGDKKSGHYQVTGYDRTHGKVVTAFNRHKNGNVDTRTNIYYLQSLDFGKTWTTADGKVVETPVTDLDSPCLILDAQSKGQNVYIKDVNFDADGNAVILYVTTYGHQPGPDHGPRAFWTANWDGSKWNFHEICSTYHAYDSGSIWVDGKHWKVIVPSEPGASLWGQGGEIAVWETKNAGKTWKKTADLTKESARNQGYVRRPYGGTDPFFCYWCDGNPDRLTECHLYFADSKGNKWELPYEMHAEWAAPIPMGQKEQAPDAGESMKDLTARVFERAKVQFSVLEKSSPEDGMVYTYKGGAVTTSKANGWTSGFFPGSLWYVYEYTGDPAFRALAEKETAKLSGIVGMKTHHDIGFQTNSSWGNEYRLTGAPEALEIMKAAAAKLAGRFNPVCGVIKSWDNKKWDYPVIIDNMMNLELLMATSRLAGVDSLKNVACTHANTTIRNHFRPDMSCYHVVAYNPETGEVVKKQTAQGFSDESCWSRGESWALYGYSMMYRESGDKVFLDQARKIAQYMMPLLPEDGVPEWDFNAPGTAHAFGMDAKGAPNAEKYLWKEGDPVLRDASAAAITASALVELSTVVPGAEGKSYKAMAEKILRTLASPAYLAAPGAQGGFLLMHGAVNVHGWNDVDVPLTYADYYFLEALLRYKKAY